MCIISIFLCFALVPKLVPRTVDFHWYWYRILKFWYRDNTNSNDAIIISSNKVSKARNHMVLLNKTVKIHNVL